MSATRLYRPIELMQNEKITKFEFDDFIGVWKNFVPRPLCDEVIEYFDDIMDRDGAYIPPYENKTAYSIGEDTIERSEDYYGDALSRKDYTLLLNYSNRDLTTKINSCLKSCILHYIEQFPQLKHTSLISTDVKMQKTPPGGGYHLWHYENALMSFAMREVTWMIYLNDMPEGDGETEFLYQKRRIRPTAGTVVMWPAGYTHTHKGSTVFTQDKYILTGWYIKTK
jgi:hypothetical protein